ncbi:MAG: hypothetical protein M3389_07210 [Actinomycetota bacterium]|nr:hypothetical protein [Actinomycetota bacterium]
MGAQEELRSPEPDDARVRLTLAFLGVGDVFMVPCTLARLGRSAKPERPWVVVALEGPARSPARATLIPGTSDRGSGPRVVAEEGEAGLWRRTTFLCKIPPAVVVARRLVTEGRALGRLGAERVAELDAAYAAAEERRRRRRQT